MGNSSVIGAKALRVGRLSLLVVAACANSVGDAQTNSGYYLKKFEDVDAAGKSMVSALADAMLDSACLNKANFDRATAGLDPQAKATAVRMRNEGIRTLNETRAWNMCRSQRDSAIRLGMDMSSAQTWSVVHTRAKRDAILADNEEIDNGLLVDHSSKAPITSEPRPAFPIDMRSLTSGALGIRGPFDAVLTVSEDGLVTDCNVAISSGSQGADSAICRKAKLLLRFRPAFTAGRLTTSTTHLSIGFN